MKHKENFIITQEIYKKIYTPSLNGELGGLTKYTWTTDNSLDYYKTASDYRLKIEIGSISNDITSYYDKVALVLTSRDSIQESDFTTKCVVDGEKLIVDVTDYVLGDKKGQIFYLTCKETKSHTFFKGDTNLTYLLFEINGEKERFTKLPLVDKATAVVRIQDGEMKVGAELISAQDSAHGVGVDYVLSSDGFTLSLNENFDGKIWVDAYGKSKKLNTTYYYEKNDQRIYLLPYLVEVQNDGSYTYTIEDTTYSVTKEQLFEDGTIAIVETKDVKHANLIDSRSDELKQIQEQKKNCEAIVSDMVAWNWQDNENLKLESFVRTVKLSDKTSFKNVERCVSSGYKVSTKAEYLQLRQLVDQLKSQAETFDKDTLTNEDIVPFVTILASDSESQINKNDIQLATELLASDKRLKDYCKNYLNKSLSAGVGYALIDKVGLQINASTTYYHKDYESGENLEGIPYCLKGQDIIDLLYRRNGYVIQLEKIRKERLLQLENLESQIDYYESLSERYMQRLSSAVKEYYALNEKEQEIIRNTPINFIKSGDSFKGFNEQGELIVLFKSNNVYVSINRDKDGKIVSLSDEKENAVIFNYAEDKLAYITDVRGRNVSISNTDNITTITYPDGSDLSISLQENDSAKIINFEKDGIKSVLEYTTDGRFEKATRYNGSDVIDFAELIIEQTEKWQQKQITFDMFDKSQKVYYTDEDVITSEYLLKGGVVVQALMQRETVDGETGLKTSKTVTYASQDSLYSTIGNVSFTGDSQTDELNKKGNSLTTTTETAEQTAVTQRTFNEHNQCLKEKSTITNKKDGSVYVAMTEHNYNAQGLKVKTVSYVVGEEQANGKTVEEWVYDKNGNLKEAFTYNTLDSSSKFYTSQPIYNANNEHIGDFDQTGEHKTEVEYVDKTTLLKTQKTAGGTTFAYGYDLADRVTAITQSTEDGEENSTQRIYENGLLTKLISGNTVIEYAYNTKRRLASITVNGVVEKTYEYSQDDKTITLLDKDGITWVTVKDDFGKVTSITKNGVEIERNTYTNGLLTESLRNGVTTSYEYDSEQRLASKTVDGVTTTYTYDNFGNVTQITKEDEAITVYEYSQDSQHKLLAATESGFKTEIKTDASGRVVERKFTNVENNAFDTERIAYLKKGDHTTNVPQSIVYANRVQSGMKDTLKYFYDARGNICQINENGKLLTKYTYDSLNRLIREDNVKLGKTYLFDYDGTGNITSKRECTFTLDKTESLTSFDKEQIATYNGDQLVYGLKSICTYSNGKVTRYDGKLIYFKQGGLISSFDNVIIAYDNYGRRRNKAGMSYTYNAKNLVVSQSNGISFIYDHNDQMVGIKNGTTPYYFRKNLQGDIVALLDSYGFVVVRYYYDAWGNHKVYNDSGVEITDTTHIGHLNPIRYRGYYYDTEFGFYYLKSRYYDPTVGRFISQDDVDYADYESINGLNLYAYCNNNPVMNSDPSGNSWKSFISWVKTSFKTIGNWFAGLFGYESRSSLGFDSSPNIASGFFGRLGFFSYSTDVKGRSSLFYAFTGNTVDVMNWFGKTYYAGVGFDLFGLVGSEVQVETVGLGAKVSVGRFSVGININLIGGTSVAIAKDTDLEKGVTKTDGFTVGVNTGCLVAIILWIYKFLAMGDPSPMPGLQPI